MARNRSSAQRTQAKRKKLIMEGLPSHLVASIDADGKIQIKSLDLRGKENYGLISKLGVNLRRLLIHKEPHLEACDREFLARQSLPLYSDRPNGVVIY